VAGQAVHVRAVRGTRDRARTLSFFARLAVKERIAPRLHVRPLVAELFLTDNCNLKCVSCACWRTTTRGELTTEEWFAVVGQLPALGIVKANFTGGEPLLRPDAAEIIDFARSRGISSLHLNTNGVLLNARRREAVLAAGVRSFNISIDGPSAETHDLIRGVVGSFDKTVGNLENLLARRTALRLRIRLNFTVMRSNMTSLPEMMRLAQRLRLPLYLNLATDHTFLFRDAQVAIESQVATTELDDVLRQVEALVHRDPDHLPRFSELRYLRRHFAEVVQPGLPCAESQLKLMVHSRGEVGGCWAHDPHANVRDSSLAVIVASPRYRDDHARFFRKDCVGCGSNYSLNLAWRPLSYWEDLQWRLGRRSLVGGG